MDQEGSAAKTLGPLAVLNDWKDDLGRGVIVRLEQMLIAGIQGERARDPLLRRMRELAARKHTLAPETIAAVERSLRTIDAALAEAREALARDPASETLARLLVAGHDQKVELLRHATRLATQS